MHHFGDDDVTQYMDIESCTTLEDAREIIAFHEADPGCRWGLFDKATGALVGTCGYHAWERGQPTPEAEVGYDLGRAYWGAGLMTEAMHVVIPFGFERMGLVKIYAGVERKNDRSIRVLERMSFERRGIEQDGLIYFDLFHTRWRDASFG